MKSSTRNLVISLVGLLAFNSYSQQNKYQRMNEETPIIQYTQQKCYSRSIIVRDSILYSANSNGTLYAYDLKKDSSYNLMTNKKFEEMRDIAFVGDYLFGMQSGTYGILAKTNGRSFIDYIIPSGNIWFGVFLDGMDFYNNTGFIMGDPKDGFFTLSYSLDGGNTWLACEGKVPHMEGEAGFAASGTNVQVLNDSTFVFVTGGKKSRYFISNDRGKTWRWTSLPFLTSQTSGAFSIHMLDETNGVLVGGDYANPDLNLNAAYFTDDGGKFWMNADVQPRGYRSCVIFAQGNYYTCGTNGIDVSLDQGREWIPFADGNFFALTADDDHLYATMKDGKVKVMELVKKKIK
jgi:hypothetical protein